MSAPFITRNQTIDVNQGEWTVRKLRIENTGWGKPTVKCVAYGLPQGLYIEDDGLIKGTPVKYGSRSAFIIATNPYGTDSAIVNFEIKKIPNDLSIQVSPPHGYAKSTEYSFVSNAVETLSGYTFKWNFGDGSYSDEYSTKHSYEIPGIYHSTLDIHYNDTLFRSLSTTIDVHLLINESIYFDYVPPPNFAGHLNRHPFKIIFTSSTEGPHYIDLAAQYSRSYEHQTPVNKWSFIRPEWRFLDLDGNIIDHITPNETKLYCDAVGKLNQKGDGLFVGVTGSVEFYFVDDMHNFDLSVNDYPYSTVIATLRTSGIKSIYDSTNINENIPGYANSLATTAAPYMTLLRVPDYLRISENGVRDYINPRWQNAEQPVVAYLNFKYPYPDPYLWDDGGNSIKLYNPESIFSHAFPVSSGEVIPVDMGVTGVDGYRFEPEPVEFKYEDEDGYRTSGYYKGKFYVDTVESLNAQVTGAVSIEITTLSAMFYNPIIWLSNPEAGMMTTAQYVRTPSMSAIVNTPNQNIAINTNFFMPIQTKVDFQKDPMALTGFHGIHCIAATQFPQYHAWALDSELNTLYRITTYGKLLCAISLNDMVSTNNLGFLVDKQVSPSSLVLDSKQNIWITLHDTVSTLKLDRWGNFLFAINPYTAIEYSFPQRKPDINDPWYSQNSYYMEDSRYKPVGNNIYGENVGDSFGRAVSLNSTGDTFIVGSLGSNTGVARVYSRSGTSFTQLGNALSGSGSDDWFGYSVSINSTGDVIAVGSPRSDAAGTDSGMAEVFQWNISLSAWESRGSSLLGASLSGFSGYSVSLNDAGDIIAIGSPYDNDAGFRAGSVEVYSWNGTSWNQLGSDIMGLSAGETAGLSVSLNGAGNILAIGSPAKENVVDMPGAARVFYWNTSISDWTQMGSDLIENTTQDGMGTSVSLNNAGDIVAVGVPYFDDQRGFVNVYKWDGASWTQIGKPILGEAELDQSGWSVSLDSSGYHVAIGSVASNNFQGSARVFYWTGINPRGPGAVWNKYSEAQNIDQDIIEPYPNSQLGHSVSLSDDAHLLIVGAPTTLNRGSVGLYTLDLSLGSGWITGLPQGLPNELNDIDINPFVEPNFIDSDSEDNVWISYSTFLSGYVMKYDKDGGLLYSHSYPVCASPQQLVVDNQDNVWISVTNNIWDSKTCHLEKRSSDGVLLSSFGPFRGLNYVTLDLYQNPWFTYSYSWIGSVNNKTGDIFVTNLSGTNETANAADWFDPDINTDETALEGIACDMRNRIFVVNSLENQIYVIDANNKTFLDKFYLNPQGFGYYINNQQGDQYMIANIWNKSLQASGDWTGLRWFNKYKEHLPYFNDKTFVVNLTGESRKLEFPRRENYELFKKNESFKLANYIKSLVNIPTLAESNVLFDDILSSIYGKYPYNHDDLGVIMFEKISNFVMNNSDIDTCEIEKIFSLANELGVDIENYNLPLPVSLKRIMDYISINQSRLFGSYSMQDDYFSENNIQGERNLGNQITSTTHSITAGDRLVLKDKTLNKYRLVETSTISGNDVYSLEELIPTLGLHTSSMNYIYEFFEFKPGYPNTQLEGVIDWSHPQTTLSRYLSTNKFWMDDESVVDMHISYDLYKGLGLI